MERNVWFRSHTGPLVHAVDMCFVRHTLRDATRLYRSVADHWQHDVFATNIVHHAAYGGGTNAVHLLLLKRLECNIVAPTHSLRRVVKHVVNAASHGGFAAIPPPTPHPSDP